jgi:hypothetical protein
MKLVLPLILIACLVGGCAAKGGDAKVERADEQGIHVKTRNAEVWVGDLSEFVSTLTGPDNANAPSSISEDENGWAATLGSAWAPLRASVNDQTAWMFAGAGILLMLAGVVLAWRGKYTLAAMVGMLGVFVAGFPVIMERGGGILTGLFILTVVALGVAGGWVAWRRYRYERLKCARESAQKLKEQGDRRAAVAVLREAKAPEWELENVKSDVAEAKVASSIRIHAIDSQPA